MTDTNLEGQLIAASSSLPSGICFTKEEEAVPGITLETLASKGTGCEGRLLLETTELYRMFSYPGMSTKNMHISITAADNRK
ncbi:unnamed protein product [Pleuronectes platessa]|uniref:Uncharacterized protein n=1 Tax=Pleuronectes platessa TaxID=8262 RepID=A0A9N7VTQ8_PLEPL|nr:unnamed protein product [Pleuronectes platessa]